MFRPLRPDEVEVRVGNVSRQGKGVSLLLFKDARVDANILDETVGSANWQCEFYECKGTLFCKVGILIRRSDGLSEWVWKDDAGSPSNMEAAKGEASDAFKRSCYKWGLGRELYTAPFIWVNAADCNMVDRNGKWQCLDTFSVTEMAVSEGRIASLTVVNEKTGRVVYRLGNAPQPQMPDEDKAECAAIAERLGGDRRAVFAAYQANGIEGARALLAANPEQIELYETEQEF